MDGQTIKILRDYFLTALIAVLAALLIRNFILEAYRIPSLAMKPTLLPGDVIFVAKWPFKIQENTIPKRGDVVIFSEGVDADLSMGSDYIKRVIGLPGDLVAVHKGQVFLNGKSLYVIKNPRHEECALEILPEGRSFGICSEPPLLSEVQPLKVPADSVFVVGDYRSRSTQKSAVGPNEEVEKKPKGWGIIPISSIKGRALWIWLSIDPHLDFGESTNWPPRLRIDRMFREVK